MKTYCNGENTQIVENKFYGYKFEEEDLPEKEYMEEISYTSTFREYVIKHARRVGYNDDMNDNKKVAKFLYELCKRENIDISRQTLNNWLESGSANGRKNVYLLCFALKMDIDQVQEFFLKAYLERPFNYKSINEAVYFFCFNNRYSYADAIQLISQVECLPKLENEYADDNTEEIGEKIRLITTKDEFIKYIYENQSGFAVQNKRAIAMINELLESCYLIAPKEYDMRHPNYNKKEKKKDDKNENHIKVNSIDKLLSVIYGYYARASEKIGEASDERTPVYEISISKSDFPERIKRNWPQAQQISNIRKGKAKYEVIRKAIIMLAFYDFAANAIVKDKECIEYGIFDELIDEVNRILVDCGYPQLYWRNPYDWMIAYCASSNDPLETLRSLIAEYYLNDIDF